MEWGMLTAVLVSIIGWLLDRGIKGIDKRLDCMDERIEENTKARLLRAGKQSVSCSSST